MEPFVLFGVCPLFYSHLWPNLRPVPVMRPVVGSFGVFLCFAGMSVVYGFWGPNPTPQITLVSTSKTLRFKGKMSNFGAKTTIKQGKRHQKDKWFHFHAYATPIMWITRFQSSRREMCFYCDWRSLCGNPTRCRPRCEHRCERDAAIWWRGGDFSGGGGGGRTSHRATCQTFCERLIQGAGRGGSAGTCRSTTSACCSTPRSMRDREKERHGPPLRKRRGGKVWTPLTKAGDLPILWKICASLLRTGTQSASGVLSHHLKCEMKSPHLVDFSWDFVDSLSN